ncbi:hypothetical protein GCK32_020441 [Trichostrongylus colubriformis]|uniref:Uncharacterized protein n=1 Tax=Trichostrongylus colubriformis TaxID=6319 RepID=A0AAN8FNZ2_TRICO
MLYRLLFHIAFVLALVYTTEECCGGWRRGYWGGMGPWGGWGGMGPWGGMMGPWGGMMGPWGGMSPWGYGGYGSPFGLFGK